MKNQWFNLTVEEITLLNSYRKADGSIPEKEELAAAIYLSLEEIADDAVRDMAAQLSRALEAMPDEQYARIDWSRGFTVEDLLE